MIGELASVLVLGGLGLGGVVDRGVGPLRGATKPPLDNNLMSGGDLERCTLRWKAAKTVGAAVDTSVSEWHDIVFPLDYNPTKFKITRSPYFAGGQSSAGARVGDANVRYSTGTPYVELHFVLDNTEGKDETEPQNKNVVLGTRLLPFQRTRKDPGAPDSNQKRVYHQMRVLHSMLEPIDHDPERAALSKPDDATGVVDDHKVLTQFNRLLADTEQTVFRAHTTYKVRDRQPTGVWMDWGEFRFLGIVRNLNMTVTAMDGAGNPRRVEVFLKMKGQIFEPLGDNPGTTDGYKKAPGGDVLDLANPEAIRARKYDLETAFLARMRGARLKEAREIFGTDQDS